MLGLTFSLLYSFITSRIVNTSVFTLRRGSYLNRATRRLALMAVQADQSRNYKLQSVKNRQSCGCGHCGGHVRDRVPVYAVSFISSISKDGQGR